MNQPLNPENAAEFTQVFQVSAILFAHEKFQDKSRNPDLREEDRFMKTFMKVKDLRSRCLSEFRQGKSEAHSAEVQR